MVKQWLKLTMMMALVAGASVTHASNHRTRSEVAGPKPKMMTIDTCVRACLACDQGNVVSCAVCALCSEPA
jgi:hypothetical protein